nr:hydroxymethylglutaryl-CoA lyase [Microbacterium pseudoresistens]
MPTRVRVYEVGPRDGLQAESRVVPTAEKVRFIRALRSAGLETVEATSFVAPGWIPQLDDAAEIMAELESDAEHLPVLVPNQRGVERALAAGSRAVAVFVSATETFAQRNLNRSLREAMDAALDAVAYARAAGMTVRGYVSMVFGDPWEGAVSLSNVAAISAELLSAGCDEISLGDTIGVATPGHVARAVERLDATGVPSSAIALHLHDTYGQALANVLEGLRAGVTTFDSSAGGLGGCPYAGSATGNLATEDLLWMLTGLGIETDVDLRAVHRAGSRVSTILGRASVSRVAAALEAPRPA